MGLPIIIVVELTSMCHFMSLHFTWISKFLLTKRALVFQITWNQCFICLIIVHTCLTNLCAIFHASVMKQMNCRVFRNIGTCSPTFYFEENLQFALEQQL